MIVSCKSNKIGKSLTTYIFTLKATSVTIGLQKIAYSVYETDEYLVVCTEVLSGNISGQSIDIDYATTSDTAQCMCKVN